MLLGGDYILVSVVVVVVLLVLVCALGLVVVFFLLVLLMPIMPLRLVVVRVVVVAGAGVVLVVLVVDIFDELVLISVVAGVVWAEAARLPPTSRVARKPKKRFISEKGVEVEGLKLTPGVLVRRISRSVRLVLSKPIAVLLQRSILLLKTCALLR